MKDKSEDYRLQFSFCECVYVSCMFFINKGQYSFVWMGTVYFSYSLS